MTEEEKNKVRLLCRIIRADSSLKASITLYDLNGEDIPAGLIRAVAKSRRVVDGILQDLSIESHENAETWEDFFNGLITFPELGAVAQ